MNPLIVSIIRNSLLLLCSFTAVAQQSLTYSDFMLQVKEKHPLAIQTKLLKEQGNLMVKESRGAFDPTLSSKYKEKKYKDKYYYTIFQSDVNVQTRLGVGFKAGYANNTGAFVNPENYTPYGGTGYLGINIPLGFGLFTDQNRLGYKIAGQEQKQMEAIADNQLNTLYYEATKVYWKWYAKHFTLDNLDSAKTLAHDRLDYVRQEFFLGESSGVDTLKAYVQLQDWQIQYLDASKEETKAYFELLKWIWDKDLLDNSVLTPTNEGLLLLVGSGEGSRIDNHPKLIQYRAKIAKNEYKRKFKIEKLKPKLNFEYNLLYNQVLPSFANVADNQLWSISFKYPLFLRGERAALKIANLKLEQLELDYKNTENVMMVALQSEVEQLRILDQQLVENKDLVFNYSELLRFENIKFSIGESSLFEVNAWQNKLIAGKNKQLKTEMNLAIGAGKVLYYNNKWNTIF